MPRLLVVHHSPTPSVAALTEAVVAGASDDAIEGVEVVVRSALEADADDVLAADGYVLGTPANFGYMSGALKHFFDTIFLPYLVGGIIPGLIAAVIFHYLTLPGIRAFQKRRAKKLRERAEKLRLGARARARAEVAASAAATALVPPANEPDPPL